LIKQTARIHIAKSSSMYFACILYFLLIQFIFNNVYGQRELSLQAGNAIALFDNLQYEAASSEFKKLLEKFPKDALYQYYLGGSLVELNSSPDEAIEYLKLSLGKDANIKAWYYLAKVYYRQYRFQEAKDALSEFKQNASWQENNNCNTKEEEERLEHAAKFFSKGTKLSITETKKIRKDSIASYISRYVYFKPVKSEGNFVVSSVESDYNEGKRQKYRFVSAESTMNLRGKDIYMMKKLTGDVWSEPVNIGTTVNSTADEEFPFFNPQTGFLYFASNRQTSMGGFDIFKTHFDSSDNQWSEPQQMLFPVNTPYNDMVWIEKENEILFVSDRNTSNIFCTLYRIEKTIPDPEVQVNYNDLVQLSDLKVTSKKSFPVDSDNEKIISAVKDTFAARNTYVNEISGVLALQKQCDSLSQLTANLKLKLKSTEDKDARAKIFSELTRIDKLTGSCQKGANSIYARTNEIVDNNMVMRSGTNGYNNQSDTFIFEIDEENAYSDENPIPLEFVLPEGIVYRIQLGVYSKPLPYDIIGGLRPVTSEFLNDGKAIKYYTGVFNRFNDADMALTKVKASGFKEAFVLAYFNKKKIPLDRAKELENRRQ
jgi:hypothetical protein